jgi:hypothetical protein
VLKVGEIFETTKGQPGKWQFGRYLVLSLDNWGHPDLLVLRPQPYSSERAGDKLWMDLEVLFPELY